jgi:hypothetical protein
MGRVVLQNKVTVSSGCCILDTSQIIRAMYAVPDLQLDRLAFFQLQTVRIPETRKPPTTPGLLPPGESGGGGRLTASKSDRRLA